MQNEHLRSSGIRFDPQPLTLEGASFDNAVGSYSTPLAHLMQPRALTADELALPEGAAGGPNPYVDYSRSYTAEGGIALSYKTDTLSFWGIVIRFLIWIGAMGAGSWLTFALFAHANGCASLSDCTYSSQQGWSAASGLLIGGGLLAMLLMLPSHAIHTIEIRPDCLIIDGEDIFWAAHMEARPSFSADELGGHTLRGIYGTRYMEFLTLRPVDDNDATPAVLANHIENALRQLWDKPQVWSGD